MNFYVYHYCDPESGTPFWVGKGCRRRAYQHLSQSKNPHHKSYDTFFYRKLRKMLLFGINPDIKIVKDQLKEEEAFDLEMSDIKRIGRRDQGKGPLTNLTDGGEGASGHKHTEETKRKVSEANLGKVISKETRQRLREANLGKKHTEESKLRMSNSHLGKTLSETHRRKIGKAHKDKVTSEETRQKMSQSQPSRRPVEGFDKLGNMVCQFNGVNRVVKGGFSLTCVSSCLAGHQKTHRDLYWRYSNQSNEKPTEETLKKAFIVTTRVPVSCFDSFGKLVAQFDSGRAVTKMGFSPTCVSNCLKGYAKTHKGLYWRYSHA